VSGGVAPQLLDKGRRNSALSRSGLAAIEFKRGKKALLEVWQLLFDIVREGFLV
jgi:hypothetical protein